MGVVVSARTLKRSRTLHISDAPEPTTIPWRLLYEIIVAKNSCRVRAGEVQKRAFLNTSI